ncbi:Iron-sulfur cluster assembly protein SufD [hydrothermal vent metagenome]|uniref:Iron-sulfur cluster assembly protein SufD n=1 Tax=hydrothermal vent metagenome TaxID=652676 RepID=A0A3B1DJ84_9ZZZZ
MTTTLVTATDQAELALLKLHQKFLSESPADAFVAFNKAAIKRFELLKFPHRKHEMYTFANTKDLVSTPFALATESQVSKDFIKSHVFPECESSYLAIVDGVLRDDLSDCSAVESAINLVPLEEAVAQPDIKAHLDETIEKENDVFAAINTAFLSHGTLIDVPAKKQATSPLQILHVSTGSASGNVALHPRVLVRLGEEAELKMIVKYVGVRGNYLVNSVMDILVGEQAGITYAQVQEDAADAWHCSKTRVFSGRNSRVKAVNAFFGNKFTRHHFEAHLKDVGAELTLNSVSVLNDAEQVHHFVRIHHASPHTTSAQNFKNIVNDKSRSSVDGTVIVNQGAQQTYSDQLINNLMLSDDAHADNKPNLMIFADDVKCTHGATVGQLDESQLFYLKTRGLKEKVARELLTKSFAESIVQTIDFPSVVDYLEKTLLKKLEA